MGVVSNSFLEKIVISLFALLLLASCGGGGGNNAAGPADGAGNGTGVPDVPIQPSEAIYPGEISGQEYNALTPQQKYQLANKLLATMFRGVTVDEFFDTQNGLSQPVLKQPSNYLLDIRTKLEIELSQTQRDDLSVVIAGYDDVGTENDVNGVYSINYADANSTWLKELALGRILHYPLSKDMFDHWVAYILTNSILFSPAEESDSASIRDVQKVYNKLVDDLRSNKTISQILQRHQRTQENWRRFSSPGENVRNMMSIYLGISDQDGDVARAEIACKDWYLSDEANGYELLSTLSPNSLPQMVLGEFVISCGNFYDGISRHPSLVPHVTRVLVDHFHSSRNDLDKQNITEAILSSNPQTFQQIFKSILFSKEYLLNTERPKTFEESFLSMSQRLGWEPYSRLLENLFDDSSMLSMTQMGWASMFYKYSREAEMPLNAMSFAHQQHALRDGLLLDGGSGRSCVATSRCMSCTTGRCNWKYGLGLVSKAEPAALPLDATPQQQAKYNFDLDNYNRYAGVFNRIHNLTLNDCIDYLFISALSRPASAVEKADLTDVFDAKMMLIDVSGEKQVSINYYDEVAQIAFDYMSRLHETYYHLKIN